MSALFGHPFTDMHLYAAPPCLSSSPSTHHQDFYPIDVYSRRPHHVRTPSYNYYARSLTPGGGCGGCGYTAGRSWVHHGTLPSLTVVNASSDLRFLNAFRLVTRGFLKTGTYDTDESRVRSRIYEKLLHY